MSAAGEYLRSMPLDTSVTVYLINGAAFQGRLNEDSTEGVVALYSTDKGNFNQAATIRHFIIACDQIAAWELHKFGTDVRIACGTDV